VQAGAFAVNRLRSGVVIGPDAVENESQQYGKYYAELQENCISNLMIATKPVTVNDAVQQRAVNAATSPVPRTSPPSSVYDIVAAQLRSRLTTTSLNGQAEFGLSFRLFRE
jgi:hypothetical protein